MRWFRWHSGTTTDPKWRVVAADAGVRVADVVAVWSAMMENANDSPVRGELHGWRDRVVAAALEIPAESVAAIRQAMQGLTLDGDKLTGWAKRQPAREDETAAERKRRQREKGKASRTVTHGHAPDKSREEEIREEARQTDARAGEPAVLKLHTTDTREDAISAIIRAANRGMAENPALDDPKPIMSGHGYSRQAAGEWLDAGVPAELAAAVVYERAKAYKPNGERAGITSLAYFRLAVREENEKRRAKEGAPPSAPAVLTPEQEWRAANPAEYAALEDEVRSRLERHESYARGSEGVRKTQLQMAVQQAVRKRIAAALERSA